MNDIVISVSNLSKQYRLGDIGTKSLAEDFNRVWHKLIGRPDPYLSAGGLNDRTKSSLDKFVWSLKNLNFEIIEGTVTGIIGRNGAGKSTLLKILSRTTAPTVGSVKIRGRIASLLEVGTGFHPELTGKENIFLNGAILGMSKREIRSKFDEIVNFSGVEKYVDTPVKRYSSGMYVRLAFAVAAHLESEILIVDEVLAVGDSEFQKKCLGRMKEVSKNDGRTVLFVSHNMSAIENLCQNVIVLNEGQIHSVSDTTNGINSYLSLNQHNALKSPLELRSDRQGTGDLLFTSVKILDGTTRNEINAVSSGQDIIIRLGIRLRTGVSCEKLHVGVGLNDMLDVRICHINNDLVNDDLDGISSLSKHIDIILSELPLNTGIYNLTVFASINGVVSDWVQNAYYFSVEGGDFYKTGKAVAANAGSFLLKFKFAV